MPASIVVGGQYGSEGKGKIVALLAKQANSPWLVRCGGPNSGHTVTIDRRETILRQVPCSSDPEKATFCVAAGCVVDEEILLKELDLLRIPRERIIVDPRAVLVSEHDRQTESRTLGHIGSTCSGTGSAQFRRALRTNDVRFTKHSSNLQARCTIESVAPLLHDRIEDGGDVIVEGTQGFGLSLLHGSEYPYVTSRDTTAAAFAMEAGLSPLHIDKIIMVVRTFPIRVAGTSGPLLNEITWDEVHSISGAPSVQPEYTSVTKRLRRVAKFDIDLVKTACRYNSPTSLAVMGLDRLDYANTHIESIDQLSKSARAFIDEIEYQTKIPVEFLGTGFGTFDSIHVAVHQANRALSYV
jgi:adenylosuccinate synthase